MDQDRNHPLGRLLVEHSAPPGLLDRALGRRRAPWRWPTPVLAMGAASVGFVLGLGVDVLAPAGHEGAPPLASAPSASVPLRLVYANPDAAQVAVAATWNSWDSEAQSLVPIGDGLFVTTVYLDPGHYEYMFVVDGAWVTDATAASWRDDGFGNRNAVIEL